MRHAEKAEGWPEADKALDPFWPLSPAGIARARGLPARFAGAGLAAVYASRTVRAFATGLPVAEAAGAPLVVDPASTVKPEMDAFLARLRQRHPADRAVLVVGHSNTIPELLRRLGATPGLLRRPGDQGERRRRPRDRGLRRPLEGGAGEARLRGDDARAACSLGRTRRYDLAVVTASCFKELQSLFHERLVVLEDAAMSGVVVEDELGVRKATRQIDRVAAGHHLVVIAIRHQNRLMNARQIGGR